MPEKWGERGYAHAKCSAELAGQLRPWLESVIKNDLTMKVGGGISPIEAASELRSRVPATSRGEFAPATVGKRFFHPIDIAPLIFFRVTFGALMTWEIWRYLSGGQLRRVFIEPTFYFKYFGFGWVPTPPDTWIYVLACALLLSAAGITLGLFYRFCAWVFAIGFTWLFLMEAAHYLNHFYLICLLSFFATLLPANRLCAFDLLRNRNLYSDVAPAWMLWVLRAQVAIVYFYGGIAKLNADWLSGEPVRTWLGWRAGEEGTWPAVASLLRSEWAVGFIAYGGLAFDLLIVPLLLWRKTRVLAFALAVVFHVTNDWLFSIGVFPWMGIALTALFFPPESFRRFGTRLGLFEAPSSTVRNLNQIGFRYRRVILGSVAVYFLCQVLLPLRHHLYPGEVGWTEEGHRFSWRMKLRNKAGSNEFYLRNPNTGEVSPIDLTQYLTARQIQKMAGQPDMILQFAHHLAERHTAADVHVLARAALNHHPSALLIDPEVNLAAVRESFLPGRWILPFGNQHQAPPWLRNFDRSQNPARPPAEVNPSGTE